MVIPKSMSYTGFLQSHHPQTALNGFVQLKHAIDRDATEANRYLQAEDSDLSMLTGWIAKCEQIPIRCALFDAISAVVSNATINVGVFVQRIVSSNISVLTECLFANTHSLVTSTLRLLRCLNSRNDVVLYQRMQLNFASKLWCNSIEVAASSKKVQTDRLTKESQEAKEKVRAECVGFLVSYLMSDRDDVVSYALKTEGFLNTLTRGIKNDSSTSVDCVLNTLLHCVVRTRKLSRYDKVHLLMRNIRLIRSLPADSK